MKNFFRLILVGLVFVLTGCGEKAEEKAAANQAAEKKELLFYCGITMVKPVSELIENFEKKHDCTIRLTQGGSKDLYASLRHSQKGDLYLPGSLSYRNNNLKDGLLLDGKFVGYNKASLVVKKGNPHSVKADVNELLRKDIKVVLCNPESGSIGRETKKILENAGIYDEAMANTIMLTTDSRNLSNAIFKDNADVVINWYATTFWNDNSTHVEAVPLDEKVAKKKKLVINLLKSSNHPELARAFMEYAASKEGRAVFHRYGFLTEEDLAGFDSISF